MTSGLVLIDKPQGWTSHDVVARLRKIAGTRRVGHAGTLDPMATGLLLIGINSATKLLTFLVGEDKTYFATIRLGASTITDDKESEVVAYGDEKKIHALHEDDVEKAMGKFRGSIQQVPSSVSAIKVNGERAYAKVRAGDEVKLTARAVEITTFEMMDSPQRVVEAGKTFFDVDVQVDCSSGTYIRALARDLGAALGVCGHLTALRRTRIGSYSVEDAVPMAELTRENLKITSMYDSVKDAFELRELSDQEVIDLRHGKRIATSGATSAEIAAVHSGELIAMLEPAGSQLKSSVVFALEQS